MNLPRHQFSYVHEEESVCVNTSAETLPEIIETFERYLVACGFVLPDGVHLGYEADDEIRPIHDKEINAMLDDASARMKKQVEADITADLEPSEDGKEAL